MRMRFAQVVPFALCFTLPVHADTLTQAMQKAMEYHPEIQAGVNSRLAADKQLRAAKGGYLPSVDLTAGYGREGSDNTTTRGEGDHWKTLNRGESNLALRQMVFDGFATSSEVGRQQANVNSRAYALLGTSERTALDVAQVYTDVLRRQEMVRLAEENLKSHQRVYDQISLRSARGVGRLADQDQAEARLAQAQNNLMTEKTNLADARTNYYSVVGSDPVELSEPASLAGQLPEDLQAARRQLVENSPILRSAESDVAAAEKQYEAAKSTFYPRFDAELARGADNNLDGEEGHNNEWQAMLRMRYNLFAGGSNKAELEAKSYEANQALDIRNNALRQLNEELGLSWNALNNARDQLPIARQYVDYSTRVREAYQKQFTIGERTLLDLLDSENELFTANRRYVDVRYTEEYSMYRVLGSMGYLLKSQHVVAPHEAVALSDVKNEARLPDLK